MYIEVRIFSFQFHLPCVDRKSDFSIAIVGFLENVAQLEECTTKVRAVVQFHPFSIWQIAIARSCIFPLKVPVFLVGRFMPFKSAHWIFEFEAFEQYSLFREGVDDDRTRN